MLCLIAVNVLQECIFVVIYHTKQSILSFIAVFGQHFVIVIGNTERITEIQNKLQKRKWEGLCILTATSVNYLTEDASSNRNRDNDFFVIDIDIYLLVKYKFTCIELLSRFASAAFL